MRVLFVSWAWPTHFYPMVPLAWALRAAGHEVRVATPPGLAAHVTAAGLPFVPVGHDLDAVARIREYIPGRASGTPGRGPRAVSLFADLAEAMADDLVAFARAWRPDLVVHEPTAYAGPLAAAACGARAVRMPWGADLMHRQATLDAEERELAPLFARFGLGAPDTLGALTVDLCPPTMQVPEESRPGPLHRLPMRYVPYNGAGRVPVPLPPAARRRPRVCVTWGTTVGRLDGSMFLAGEVVAALDALDVGIVVAVDGSQRRLLGTLPERAKVVESVPLHCVLPHCDLVVAHGGAGTILTGLAQGLPQLVVPQLIDHTFNAQRFAATGAGLSLGRDEARPAGLRAAVLELLEQPSYRKAAEEIRTENDRRPTPARVAAQLARLAGFLAEPSDPSEPTELPAESAESAASGAPGASAGSATSVVPVEGGRPC
ncbi:nucleotide disphospho-sugar-binding domain-containing protein [Streptomyces sp. NPDC059071]|uniref:nucleotide disphospho-sugar-binding domain-containing protein n=1 Tax=unclassified Streptomyces TaxID=2593676 RepID=UPI00365329FC